MKKSFYLLGAVAITLASCADDGLLENSVAGFTKSETGEITFSIANTQATRAFEGATAAGKLNNKFVVYGWKSNGWTNGSAKTDGAEATSGSYTNPQDVFKNYLVTYDGKNGQTESNTNGWEYVGNTSKPISGSGVEQSIKYWDYAMAQYDFIAWSITEGGATLDAIGTDSKNPYKVHSLSFSAPAASDIAKIYISNQETVAKANTTGNVYGGVVTLTFRNMAAKVRVGLYETVPGYSVKDVKFYTDNSAATTTAPTNTTVTLYDGAATKSFATSGTVKVEYRDGSVGTVNEAVVTTNADESDSKAQFGNLSGFKGAQNLEEANNVYLGRASNEATLSSGDTNADGWKYEFPKAASELTLRCDYTLVSTDGSGEEIKVRNAKAVVPSNYGEWKANYAYTYLFKISDNTNGTTGDPTTPDPAGLYPITFDAVVVDVQTGNTQETITEFAETPITTYQKGSTSTAESEYKAFADGGYIYVNNNAAAMKAKDATAANNNTKLYVAVDLNKDNEGITEETVANYANNDIVLIDVTSATAEAVEDVTKIEAAQTYDNIEKTLTKAGFRFQPQAGQTYVVEFTNAGKKVYKVIKVVGTPSNTFALTVDNATVAEGSSVTVTAKVDNNLVYGAQNYFEGASAFTVTDAGSGTYTFKANAGSTGAQSVILGGSTALAITVNAYEFVSNNNIPEGGSATITLNLGAGAAAINAADATVATTAGFAITGDGLSITKVEAGVVTIAATTAATTGKITFKNGTTEVASADITVNKYTVTAAPAIINVGGTDKHVATLTYQLGGQTITAATAVTNHDDTKAKLYGTEACDGTVVTETTAVGVVYMKAVAKGAASAIIGSATASVEVIDAAVTFTETDGTAVAADALVAGHTYYMTFKDGGTETNAALVGEGCTISKKATTGVYQVVTGAAGSAVKVKYTYKGVEFTLASKTV